MSIKIYNLLFERKTDKTILAFSNFFRDRVLKNLKEPQFKSASNSEPFPYYYTWPLDKLFSESEYENYKNLTGDTGIIIRNITDYEDMLAQFRVLVFPRNKRNALGEMSDDGKLGLYYQKWIYDPKKSEEANREFPFPNAEEIKNFIQSPEVSRVLNHELGHYTNALRSGHRRKEGIATPFYLRNKGNYDDRSQSSGYINSTEEIQARITDFLNYLENLIKTPIGQIYYLDSNDINILSGLANNNYKKFYEAAFKTSAFSIMTSLRKKTFQKFVGNRLWKIFEEYSQKDLDTYKSLRAPPLP